MPELVLGDVLPPILEWAKLKHPGIEPIRLSDYRREERVVPRVVNLPAAKERESLKRKAFTPLARILDGPKLPQPQSEQPERVKSVMYSRKFVTEKMGGTPRSKDVTRVMQAIRQFEFDQATVKTIKWSGGEREIVRTGDLRIVFNQVNGRLYALELVADREGVYRKYGDHKV